MHESNVKDIPYFSEDGDSQKVLKNGATSNETSSHTPPAERAHKAHDDNVYHN